jgi:hypothetical protein
MRLLSGHEEIYIAECEPQESKTLQSLAPGRSRRRCGISNPLIMDAACRGLTQHEDHERGITQEYVFTVGTFLVYGLYSPNLHL